MTREFILTAIALGLAISLAAQAAKANPSPNPKPRAKGQYVWLVGQEAYNTKEEALKAMLDKDLGTALKCTPMYADWTVKLRVKGKVK